MAETILAGKQVKEFSLGYGFAFMATLHAIFPRFFKNVFVGYRPRYAGDGNGEDKQPGYLRT